jgi:hypothetical protein
VNGLHFLRWWMSILCWVISSMTHPLIAWNLNVKHQATNRVKQIIRWEMRWRWCDDGSK